MYMFGKMKDRLSVMYVFGKMMCMYTMTRAALVRKLHWQEFYKRIEEKICRYMFNMKHHVTCLIACVHEKIKKIYVYICKHACLIGTP